MLRRHGFDPPEAERCLRPGRFIDEDFSSHEGTAPGERLAEEHGFPLVVKPNRGGRGRHVSVARDMDALLAVIQQVWELDYLAIVQPVVPGIDVRLDFLDGEYLFGYVRRPVVLRGDGNRSLADLLADSDPRYNDEPYRKALENETIWREKVGERRLGTVLPDGEVLDFSTPILNLNRLCRAEYLETLGADWQDHGRRIGEALGLRHYGIDFKVEEYPCAPAAAKVLEVNASPSLAQMSRMGHYEAALAAERRIVQAILSST